MSLMLIGATLGAGLGYVQNEKRKGAAKRQRQMAAFGQDAAASRLNARKQILEGQITIGAMQVASQNRENALDAFQNKAAMEASIATSGVSGGTPLYLLDQEIINNRRRLYEASSSGQASLAATSVEGRAGIKEAEYGLMAANFEIEDAREQETYLNSPFAAGMAIATGAISGIGMAASFDAGVHQLTGFTIGEQFGGKVGSDGQMMEGTINNLLFGGMKNPKYGSPYKKNYIPRSQDSMPAWGGTSRTTPFSTPSPGDTGFFNQQAFRM